MREAIDSDLLGNTATRHVDTNMESSGSHLDRPID